MAIKINILIWNCCSVRNKTAELNKRLQEFKIDIGIIIKTKLLEGDNLRLSGYDIIRYDREIGIGRGGGVMIIIQKNLKWEPILQKDIGGKNKGFETVRIKLKGEVGNRHIRGIHRKPGKRENKSTWEKLLRNKKKGNIDNGEGGGDFNAHNTIWNCNNTDINGHNLNISMEEKGLYIINNKTES